MMTRQQIIQHYRSIIDQMQGHTFYIENEDGVLQRWYPPRRPIGDKETDSES